MTDKYQPEPMLEMYLYESEQLLEQLEQIVLECERDSNYSERSIQDIFRSMHTIKGSSAMMLFNHIASLCHTLEDLFFFLREEKPKLSDWSTISDLLLSGIDFMKLELHKIREGAEAVGDTSELTLAVQYYLKELQHRYSAGEPRDMAKEKQANAEPQQFYILPDKAKGSRTYAAVHMKFDLDCEMENIRAFAVTHNLKEHSRVVRFEPEDLMDEESAKQIKDQGFRMWLETDKTLVELKLLLEETLFLRELQVEPFEPVPEMPYEEETTLPIGLETSPSSPALVIPEPPAKRGESDPLTNTNTKQSLISVSVDKLDRLLDLVGEMVIAEAMVVENTDLKGLNIPNFWKSSRQLRKISSELQDVVMSIRMVPLAPTFHKMNRIVRDMSKKLGKETQLVLIGEQTEVDKNIIEHISDPLMHLIRNAIDHGLELPEIRKANGKFPIGTITLEARNVGSEVWIQIRDDGKGLDKLKILERAKQNKLLQKPETEMSDKEVYSMIFLAGFSTKEGVTEFSGRGVGMDVVVRNIESVGGSVHVDSEGGKGSCVTLKIPLTLAIIEGMNIGIGASRFTIPTMSIRESFRPQPGMAFSDPDGNEMIMIRGECYPVLRLQELFQITSPVRALSDGILIVIDHDQDRICLFADELLGQRQVIVKALPAYFRITRKTRGLAGCTVLGDGSINLILDVPGLIQMWKSTERPIRDWKEEVVEGGGSFSL